MDRCDSSEGAEHGRVPREDEGFDLSRPVRSFVSTVRRVIFEPTGFFRDLAPRGRVRDPLVFALLCVLISLPLTIFAAPFDPFSEGAPNFPPSFFVRMFNESGAIATTLLAAVALAFFILGLVLGLYLGAAILQILVGIIVQPTNTGFEATFRVFAYAYAAAMLLNWVPVIRLLVPAYGVYLIFVGARELHATTNARAAAVALSAFVLWLLLYLPDVLPSAGA